MSNITTTALPLSLLVLDDQASWVNRFFLVGSNVGALLPMVYLIKRVRPIPYDALVFTLVAFLASFSMHLCDDDNVAGSNCVASDALLMASDLLTVNELVAVAYLYSVPSRLVSFRSIVYVLFLVVNALLYFYYPTPDEWDMIVWASIVFALVFSFHLWYRCVISKDVHHFIHHHIDITSSILFIIFASGGLTMRFIGNANYGLYSPLHSAWHITGFTAEYFFFRIFDSGGAWTWKTMDIHSQGYDVAALDDDCDTEELALSVLTG